MIPVAQPHTNAIFKAEGCDDLPATIVGGMVYTYWRPSPEEWAAITKGKPIRIIVPVYGRDDKGNPQAPMMAVDTED